MPNPTVVVSPDAKQRFFDATGIPLSGGKLFTYAAGSTTKQNTYTDSTGATPNANPIILDSAGYANVWLDQTLIYKYTLSPATDTDPPTNPIWTIDNVNGSTLPLTALAASSGSSLVGFLQSGTGAVARTLQSKDRETFSVTDFGTIDLTGAADCSAVVTLALAAATGRTLLFPSGTYKVAGTFALPANCKLQGDGYDITTIYQSTANMTTFVTNNDNEICGFKFTGTGAWSVAGRGAIECDPSGTGTHNNRVHIHDNYFDSTLSTGGITGNNQVDWLIDCNYIVLGVTGEHGIYLSGGGATRVRVTNNLLSKGVSGGLGSNAINIKGAASLWIENNFITGVGWDAYGIVSSTAASNDLQILNNRFYSLLSTAQAIRVGSSAADTSIVITGNDIDGGYIGVESEAIKSLIQGNLIKGCGNFGILVDGTGAVDTSKCVVQNNAVYDCTAGGIRIITADANTYVLNNSVVGSAGSGINYEAGSTVGGVFGNNVNGHPTLYIISVAVPSDVGSPFTPTFTNLTQTPGTGAVIITGKFYQRGNLITFFVRIRCTGTATSASVAGTTTLDAPVAVGAGFQGYIQVTGVQETPATSNRGQGAMNSSTGKFYTPAWGADSLELVIQGQYSIG